MLKIFRKLSLVSFIVKSNIALGLSWYGEFYSAKEVAKSAEPLWLASIFSLCACGIFCMIISENKAKQ